MKKILAVIILIILIPILCINCVTLIDLAINPNVVPSFFGWKPFITLTDSMEPEIYSGDLAVVKQTDTSSLKVGDIIAFNIENIVTISRIKEITQEDNEVSYITKSDNVNIQDSQHISPKQIEGIYKFNIRKLGNLVMFMQTPIGMICSMAIPIVLLILIQIYSSKMERKSYLEYDEEKIEMQKEIQQLKKENEKLRS